MLLLFLYPFFFAQREDNVAFARASTKKLENINLYELQRKFLAYQSIGFQNKEIKLADNGNFQF